jgi:hypothetical protein
MPAAGERVGVGQVRDVGSGSMSRTTPRPLPSDFGPQADFADDPDEPEDPDDPDELDPAVAELEPELLPESDELFVSVLVLVDSPEPFDSPEPDSADAEAFSEFAPFPARASLR